MRYNIKLTAVMIATLAVTFMFLTGCSNKENKKAKHFSAGNTYFEAKEYKKAEIEFKNAIQADPKYTDAYLKLGDTMMKLGKAQDAFRAYSQAETISPENVRALTVLAKFYFLNKRPEGAKARIKSSLKKIKAM